MVHTANKLTKNKPCRKYGDTAKKKHNGQGMNILPRNEIQRPLIHKLLLTQNCCKLS